MSPSSGRTLHDRLLRALAARPARDVAVSIPGAARLDLDMFERRLVGAERRLGRAAEAAAQAGGGGDPRLVLLSGRNTASYVVALAALWKSGRVPLLADADLPPAEIASLAAAFRPAFCVVDRRPPSAGATLPLGDGLGPLRAWIPPSIVRRAAAARNRIAPLPEDAAVVRLTSGSTGTPRGIVVTAPQLLADAANIAATMGITGEDTLVAAIPLGHAYGFVHVLMSSVLQGTRSILLEQPLPDLLRQALAGKGPLVFPGSPYLFQMLLETAPARRFKGLRLCLSAGAPLPSSLSAAFRERFGLPIRTFYGASECGGIAYDRSKKGVLPDGCVGTPLEGVEVRVRQEPGLQDGVGRVQVKSAAVASGYLAAVASPPIAPGLGAAPTLRGGVFLTGDLGRFDGDGTLRLEGRIDDVINVGGRKVRPAEVEAALLGVDGVRQAAVFGAADRHRGQMVCACVATARGVTREKIFAACRDRLAAFKIPRRIEFVGRIPVTARGKPDRRALVARITA